MNRDALIECLESAAGRVILSKLIKNAIDDGLVRRGLGACEEFRRLFEDLANRLTAGNLARARVSCVIAEQNQVTGKERSVGAAQVEQHAVVPGHWNNAHALNTRRATYLCSNHALTPGAGIVASSTRLISPTMGT